MYADFMLDYQQQVKRLVMEKFKEEEKEAAGHEGVRDAGCALVRQVSATA
jgi:hypothetical protein